LTGIENRKVAMYATPAISADLRSDDIGVCLEAATAGAVWVMVMSGLLRDTHRVQIGCCSNHDPLIWYSAVVPLLRWLRAAVDLA
jgi:hypothetical protein